MYKVMWWKNHSYPDMMTKVEAWLKERGDAIEIVGVNVAVDPENKDEYTHFFCSVFYRPRG